MSSQLNRRSAILRIMFIVFIIGLMASAFLYAAGFIGHKDAVTAKSFVNLQEGKPVSLKSDRAGFRRAHAKGICVTGEFQATGDLQPYSITPIFQSGSHPFIGRFSIAGNNPIAPDLKAPVRSLALSFSEPNWRIAMNTPPVMAVSTPEDFYKQLVSLQPDPKTGKRDGKKIQAFFAAHPESKDFNNWRAGYTPTTSFAYEQYHSINAFYLVNANNEKQAVRWQAVPRRLPPAKDLKPVKVETHPDALQLDLVEKLRSGPIAFDLVFTFARATDNENDPAVAWSADNKSINAGTVIIRQSSPQAGGNCDGIRYDPLILPKGIEPTKDPILNARSAAYAESYRRRARESFFGTVEQQQGQGENK